MFSEQTSSSLRFVLLTANQSSSIRSALSIIKRTTTRCISGSSLLKDIHYSRAPRYCFAKLFSAAKNASFSWNLKKWCLPDWQFLVFNLILTVRMSKMITELWMYAFTQCLCVPVSPCCYQFARIKMTHYCRVTFYKGGIKALFWVIASMGHSENKGKHEVFT